MKFVQALLVLALAITSSPTICVAQQPLEPRTEAAVIAADDAWLQAEIKGDVGVIDALLVPEYRTISPAGAVRNKAALLESARHNTPERAATITNYQANHPVDKQVIIDGDIAVLTFTAKGDSKKFVHSCDIFVYLGGRWRAIYSQGTTAETT